MLSDELSKLYKEVQDDKLLDYSAEEVAEVLGFVSLVLAKTGAKNIPEEYLESWLSKKTQSLIALAYLFPDKYFKLRGDIDDWPDNLE